jgi:hypothetical protein
MTTSDRAERDILGMLLVSPWHLVSLGNLKPQHFQDPFHTAVYKTILETRLDGITLVAHELERRGVPPPLGSGGWCGALSSLTDGPPGGFWYVDESSLPALSRIVQEAAAKRLRSQIRPAARMADAE